ncbi:putative bifunctional diguanylate cyclase/phosphodiesterase, partial [Selenomonas sp.]|uniref:putative bifunctional diguanylate cyclase/phosphodiesterase n=1 Tax=Selenomonas sp. TaxID=2053611 RepID=UPI003FA26A6D
PWESVASWEQDFFLEGEKFIYRVTMSKLFDADGRYKGYYYAVRDTHAESEEESAELSWPRDKLTGLYDREGFYGAVREELDYGMKGGHYIICSNIKDFKLVNELMGEEKGNEILKSLAEFFSDLAMDSGAAGRLHGDHFAAYVDKERFTEHDLREGLELLSRTFDSSMFKLSIHLGIYEIQEVQMPIAVMCDRAHLALSLVHSENGNKVEFYNDALMERTLREKEILGSFDDGILERQLAVYLQPQVSAEGELLGAEALVRWNHPEKGILAPGQFIGILENAGQIHRLDQYVWEEAAAILKSWQGTEKEGLTISVNISVNDMLHLDIYQTVTDIVKRYGIDPKHLKLEITETALMGDIDKYRKLIARLQGAGFEVEIDDFGSGYSSLSMLKDIEADILKIDMGFLRQTGNAKRSSVILNAVIAMAKWLGMRVITEGVETKEQVEHLRSLGCDMFQGYFFAKPMPVAEFEAKYFCKSAG